MKNKRIIVAACVIAIMAAAVMFKLATSRGQVNPAQQVQTQVPDQVIYKHLFHHVTALKKKSEEVEKSGNDTTQFRTHFQRKADLSDDEVQALNEVAAAFAQQEESLIARAKPIVEAYKAQYPGGQVPQGQKPAPPPAELRALSQQRDALALWARDQLRIRLGNDEFTRFDTFVRSRVTPNVQQSISQ